MVTQFFSDRERGPRPRTSEILDERAWSGLVAQIDQRITNGSLGYGFPEQCPDGEGIIGCDSWNLGKALRAEVDIDWPLANQLPPDQLVVWDMLEFLFENIGKPFSVKYHPYFGHNHLSFDVEAGQQEFAASINRILARNGIAFELTEEGHVRRLLPEYIGERLAAMRFQTGDNETDKMLEAARAGITSPAFDSRKIGLEKLWDAFERLKTLEPGLDKNASANALLNKADGGPAYRELLSAEAKSLTNAGNNFGIRHFETNRELVQTHNKLTTCFSECFLSFNY